MTRRALKVARSLALIGAVGLTLTSCGSDGEPKEAAASPSPTTTVSVPSDVELTDPGTELTFGDTASVIFDTTKKRGTVLRLTVEKAEKGSVEDLTAFVLDDATRTSTPYYVTVRVENVGEGDVGGGPVPLWGVDSTNTLLPAATLTTRFKKCPSEQLPATFAGGDVLQTCLMYLAPDKGTLEAVSYRPDEKAHPIEWAAAEGS